MSLSRCILSTLMHARNILALQHEYCEQVRPAGFETMSGVVSNSNSIR
jgi:hypothetical protein